MTLNLNLAGGAIAAAFSWAVVNVSGVAQPLSPFIAAVGGILGVLLWWYTPLPSTNGGMGMGKPARQQWGWTSETRDKGGEST